MYFCFCLSIYLSISTINLEHTHTHTHIYYRNIYIYIYIPNIYIYIYIYIQYIYIYIYIYIQYIYIYIYIYLYIWKTIIDSNPTVYEKKNWQPVIQIERGDLLRNKVDTIAFRFCWAIIRAMRDYISNVKYRWMYKKCKNM